MSLRNSCLRNWGMCLCCSRNTLQKTRKKSTYPGFTQGMRLIYIMEWFGKWECFYEWTCGNSFWGSVYYELISRILYNRLQKLNLYFYFTLKYFCIEFLHQEAFLFLIPFYFFIILFMATIHAPFAPRNYSDTTHKLREIIVPSGDISSRAEDILRWAVCWYIESVGGWQTRVTTIRAK